MYKQILALGLFALPLGCSFMARGPADYKKDTRAVIETKNSDIKACYDEALEENAGTDGMVVVNFTVEKETGVFTDIQIDESETTAPESLQNCVTNSLGDLALTPEDRRDGHATFVWKFEAPEAPAAPAEDPQG